MSTFSDSRIDALKTAVSGMNTESAQLYTTKHAHAAGGHSAVDVQAWKRQRTGGGVTCIGLNTLFYNL